MASERLSELELMAMYGDVTREPFDVRNLAFRAAEEIRERRALDLTADEREVLSVLRDMLRDMNVAVWHRQHDKAVERKATALAVLDKLLARGGER